MLCLYAARIFALKCCVVLWRFITTKDPLAPGLNFVKNSLTYMFILSSAPHLIAKHVAGVTADTSFKVFGLTRLRIKPSLPVSTANALNH